MFLHLLLYGIRHWIFFYLAILDSVIDRSRKLLRVVRVHIRKLQNFFGNGGLLWSGHIRQAAFNVGIEVPIRDFFQVHTFTKMEKRGLFLFEDFFHHRFLATHKNVVQPLLPLHNGTQLSCQGLVDGVHFLEFIEHNNKPVLHRRHLLQQIQRILQHGGRLAHRRDKTHIHTFSHRVIRERRHNTEKLHKMLDFFELMYPEHLTQDLRGQVLHI